MTDFRHSLRMLRQSPGFTITALAALALGIGANTAIFTLVNTVIFQPLPFPDSGRLVNVGRPGGGGASEPVFAYWTQTDIGLEDLTAFRSGASMNLDGRDRPELVRTVMSSRNYFRLFGAHPILGRTFTAAEDSPGGHRALVLGYGLWQRRFGGDPSILDKAVSLGGALYTVVGVLSPGFQPYPPADAWAPLQADLNSANQAGILTVTGKLPHGTSLPSVDARLAVIDARYAATHKRSLAINPGMRATLMQQQIVRDVRPALLILFGAVGLVLLIACANIANLLLARANSRHKEIAIRAALGASRARIVRQLLTESLLLAMAGGVVGLSLGSWAVRALVAVMPPDLPRMQEMAAIPALDPRVAGFTFCVAVLAGLLFGMTPAVTLARAHLTEALNESGGRTSAGRKQSRTRGALVAIEMAVAVVLVCGALLLIRSVAAMYATDVGFDTRQLLTMEVSLAGPGYSSSSTVERLGRQVVERVEHMPGVEGAALASALPMWGQVDMIFDIPGRARPAGRQFTGDVQWRFVTPQYFDVLRIPLVAGRWFRDQEAGRTLIVSQTMARKFWPGANAVGQTIDIGAGLGPGYQEGIAEIVGVAGDVRERLDVDPQPVMYQTPAQIPNGDMAVLNGLERGAILVRTRRGVAPMSVSRAVEAVLDANQLPATKAQTMAQTIRDSTARQSANLLLLGIFAAIALLLAAVGIYGVVSYGVAQRTREMGIRAALGANRGDLVGPILRQSLQMAAAGIGIGIAASFGLTRLLSAQLFQVKTWDPLTFTLTPLILLLVAIAAACIPAMRAGRVDPLTALRHE